MVVRQVYTMISKLSVGDVVYKIVNSIDKHNVFDR